MKQALLIFALLFSASAFSQKTMDREFSIGLGASVYFGDMDSGNVIKDLFYLSPALQLRYKWQHNNYFHTDVNLLFGKLKGDDARSEVNERVERNLNFYSPLIELSILEEIHPLGKATFPGKVILSPYFIVGVGGYYFNPKTTDSSGEEHELQPLGTEGQGAEGYNEKYKRLKMAIPFGGGMKYKINEKYGLSFELISRYTFTDYLDDLSTDYAPIDILLKNGGEIAVELSDRRANPTYRGTRGDDGNIDFYFTYMLNFHINIFGNRLAGIKDPTGF